MTVAGSARLVGPRELLRCGLRVERRWSALSCRALSLLAFVALLLLAPVVFLTACDRKEPATETGSTKASASSTHGARTEPDATYRTRGQIIAISRGGKGGTSADSGEGTDRGPKSEFTIHHEPVPGFTNAQGVVVGMGAMEMAFPIAKDVPIDELAVGDMIEFDWAVWWSSAHRGWEVRSLRRLDPGTTLNFGRQ